MLVDLIQVLLSAALICVLPGSFWAACLRPRADIAEHLTYATAFSMALVPAAALVPTQLLGMNVTLTVAAISALAVFVTGLAAYLRFGPADDAGDKPAGQPASLTVPALILVSLVAGLALWTAFVAPEGGRYALATAILAVFAGVAGGLGSRAVDATGRRGGAPAVTDRVAPLLLLAAVLALTLPRGYLGPVSHDWPFLRGGDQFNHAVQANGMLSAGHYDAFLLYPPGFSILTASISRFSGLDPLEVFPLLAPALLLLPALACYALAKELWGPWCGVAAAAFSGLLLNGTWANIEQARYPNLVSAQFMLVVAVAALIALYRSPAPRSIVSFAVLGSSVVLYHSVGSYYAALLFALVVALILPYLLLRDRRRGGALLLSFVLLGVLAVVYAWDTYDLGRLLGGLMTGSGTGAGGEAVSIVIGTQPVFDLLGLPERVSSPVFWLALLGGTLLISTLVRGRTDLPNVLAHITLLLWCAILFIGSRTALSGFPQRFERDLGIPLAVLAAFALVAILRSLAPRRPAEDRQTGTAAITTVGAAAVASLLTLSLVGLGGWHGMEDATKPAPEAVLTPELAAAGEWLEARNTGGKIVPSPSYGAIPSRGMLAMGGYDGLQSYPERRVETPRSLPPGGAAEIKDARWLLLHPESERARRIIERYDIRYVVLSTNYPGVDPRAFEALPVLYRKEFENEAAVIFAPRESKSR